MSLSLKPDAKQVTDAGLFLPLYETSRRSLSANPENNSKKWLLRYLAQLSSKQEMLPSPAH